MEKKTTDEHGRTTDDVVKASAARVACEVLAHVECGSGDDALVEPEVLLEIVRADLRWHGLGDADADANALAARVAIFAERALSDVRAARDADDDAQGADD